MSKRFSITILVIILGVFIIPQITSAASLPFNFGEDSLVPCGRAKDEGTADAVCNLCHFFKGIKNVINLALSLVILIAPLIIIYGGFVILSSGGSPEKVTLGKSIITYVVIGLVIVFGAWLIINTVMNGLVGSNKSPLPWNKIECAVTKVTTPGEDEDNEEEIVGEANTRTCDSLSKGGLCRMASINFRCSLGIQSQIDKGLVATPTQYLYRAIRANLIADLGNEIGEKVARVSSFSDNSLGQCIDNYIGQCTGRTDSCEGTCCGHRENSDHYCKGESYAIDFGEEGYAYEICSAVLKSVKEKKAYILKESSHVHVGIGQKGNCPSASAYNITKAVCDGMK